MLKSRYYGCANHLLLPPVPAGPYFPPPVSQPGPAGIHSVPAEPLLEPARSEVWIPKSPLGGDQGEAQISLVKSFLAAQTIRIED